MQEDERDELRVTRRQDADEAGIDPSVDVAPLLHHVAVCVFDLHRAGDLRRAGLAGDGVAGDLRAPRDPVVDGVREQVQHRRGRLGLHDPLRRRLARVVLGAIGIGPAGDHVRPHEHSAVREGRVPGGELHGRHAEPLAEGVLGRGQLARRVCPVRIPHDPGRLGGQLDPGRRPEPVAQERLVQPRRSELEAELRGADVVRERQDIGGRDLAVAIGPVVAIGVLDARPTDLEVVVVDHRVGGGDGSGIERRGDGEGLHHRAGLVLAGDGRVAEPLAVGGGELVGVVRRVAGHAQNRPCLGVHDQSGDAHRVVLAERGPHLLLQQVLDARIDGETEVRTIDRFPQNGRRVGDAASGHVLVGGDRSRLPGQQHVLPGLDAVLACAVHVDEPDELRRHGRVAGRTANRVDALRLGQQADARQIQVADPLSRPVRDATLDPDPARIGVEPMAKLGHRHPQDRAKYLGRGARVGDLWRGRKDRLQLHRGRQQRAVDVGDLSAHRGKRLVLQQLGIRHLGQPRLLDHLPPHQPGADRGREQREDDQEDQGAGTAVGPCEHLVRLLRATVFGRGAWVNRRVRPGMARTGPLPRAAARDRAAHERAG